jgi:alpha/beta superfamily hydrolase
MSPGFLKGLFMTLLITLVLFGVVYLIQRRRGRKPARAVRPRTAGEKLRWAVIYVSKLIGFMVITILLIAGGVMAYVSYQAILEDTAPAPSRVDIPKGLPFQVQEVTFPGGDGLKMAGWYIPAKNGATIIVLHGYSSNRTTMLWHANVLVEAGYGVLMYDERATGESEGDYRSYGWEDPADVGGALDFLNSHPEAGQVGIAGCSMGGQIALQGAAYYPQVGAVWADGPGTITSRDTPAPFNWATALAQPSNWMMDWMMSGRLQKPIPPAMIDLIGTIEPRPVMLVAGGTPHPFYGPESRHVEYLTNFAGVHTQLWLIPEVTHCDGPIQRPEEYAARMVKFFDTALGISR